MMKLLEFPHSHYCEKARWALDYKGVPFQPVPILPGFHLWTVRKFAKETSVPVLLDGDRVIQGSSEIIDYLDTTVPARPLTPINEKESKECRGIEQEMDRSLGIPIRQILYHRLLAYPSFIRFCFTHPMPFIKQATFSLYYPLLKKKIYQVYVRSDKHVVDARKEFHGTLDRVGQRLEKKEYLVGHSFSRADVTVSSMLSLLVLPAQHPMPWPEIPDPEIRTLRDSYRTHPVYKWVENIYEKHRQPHTS